MDGHPAPQPKDYCQNCGGLLFERTPKDTFAVGEGVVQVLIKCPSCGTKHRALEYGKGETHGSLVGRLATEEDE
jgi:RNase P subunit RPR2